MSQPARHTTDEYVFQIPRIDMWGFILFILFLSGMVLALPFLPTHPSEKPMPFSCAVAIALLLQLVFIFRLYTTGRVVLSGQGIVFKPWIGRERRMEWQTLKRFRIRNGWHFQSEKSTIHFDLKGFRPKVRQEFVQMLAAILEPQFDVNDLVRKDNNLQSIRQILLSRETLHFVFRISLLLVLVGVPYYAAIRYVGMHADSINYYLAMSIVFGPMVLPMILIFLSPKYRRQRRKQSQRQRLRHRWRERNSCEQK